MGMLIIRIKSNSEGKEVNKRNVHKSRFRIAYNILYNVLYINS